MIMLIVIMMMIKVKDNLDDDDRYHHPHPDQHDHKLQYSMIVIMTKRIHRLYFTGASWKQCGQRIQAQGGGGWNR